MAAVAAGLLLILITFVVYIPAIRSGFIWDDDKCIEQNQTLQQADGLKRIWLNEKGAMPYQYYPLVYTTYWIEYRLWGGLKPGGFHFINVLCHVVGVLFFWRILRFLKIPGAWLAAAIFALHPAQVESVAWVTERKNVLSGMFYFAAAWAYLRCALTDEKQPSPAGKWTWYGVAVALFACSLLSKTAGCTLPAALLLVIWWKRGRLGHRDILAALPLFAMGVGMGLVTAWLETAPKHVAAGGADWNQSFVERCLIAGHALWFYAGTLVWPANLMFVYPRWAIDASQAWQYVYPAAALITIAVLWFMRQRIGRGPVTAVLFFAGTLFPALGFFNVYYTQFSYVADHWQYFACAGLIALFSAGMVRVIELSSSNSGWLMPLTSIALLGILGIVSAHQQRFYKDIDALWRETLYCNPDAWFAHNNLGVRLRDQGNAAEAEHHYREAIRAKPPFSDAQNNLGLLLKKQGRLDEAVEHHQLAIDSKPDSAPLHNNLANAYLSARQLNPAIEQYRIAIALDPGFPVYHYNLAMCLSASGSHEEMLAELREALRLKPDWRQPMLQIAWQLATNPDASHTEIQEALQLASRAVEITRNRDAESLDTLAVAQAAAGDFEQAVGSAQTALTLAQANQETALADQIRQHLDEFRNQRPDRSQQP